MFDIGLGNRVFREVSIRNSAGRVQESDDWAGISELGGRWCVDGILGNGR